MKEQTQALEHASVKHFVIVLVAFRVVIRFDRTQVHRLVFFIRGGVGNVGECASQFRNFILLQLVLLFRLLSSNCFRPSAGIMFGA